ncbi:DapH/DapD/GlmU-related protein [[Mycoplasma] testudinis]|uniref:DapH/DapD/GlmU-related protein n=1 Tax=[Mycoplasma] testudinis TaxID=33924 RepID=UPI00047F3BD3|nr:DapH/DapD/GlmU-related protein [[Mycoplasma] testudinis]
MKKNKFYEIDDSCSIDKGFKIYPGVVIEKNCKIGKNVTIQNGTLISNNCEIGDNVFIGPFTVIRDKTKIKNNCVVGPHCEIVRSQLKNNVKIYHRTFVGDAELSEGVQIGCGTVIANSDFSNKFKTKIRKNTKVGANCTIISPIEIGEDCFLAAGSIISKNLENKSFYRISFEKIIKKN